MSINFQTHILSNGLKVIIHEDKFSTKVAVDIVYRVGAKDEKENRTGMAHLFEHLMFGGSKNAPNYDKIVQKIGGSNNAYTNSDVTNYYITCPNNQLETVLWLESDRMINLDLSDKSIEVQKSVVCEEFKQRYLNQPYGDAYLLLRPVQYQVHPYQWMTIGKELSHIEEASKEEILSFYDTYYSPNNATLVISGGIDVNNTLKLVEKWFGEIPAKEIVRQKYQKEPLQKAPRNIVVEKDVPNTNVYKSYHMPERGSDKYNSADLLADIMGSGQNSFLFKHLVKDTQIASEVGAFCWGLYDSGTFSIVARLNDSVTTEQYEKELDFVIGELWKINSLDLLRQQNKFEASEVFGRTTVLHKATNLAIFDSFGKLNEYIDIIDHIKKVSLVDIHNSVSEILTKENCTTLYYLAKN